MAGHGRTTLLIGQPPATPGEVWPRALTPSSKTCQLTAKRNHVQSTTQARCCSYVWHPLLWPSAVCSPNREEVPCSRHQTARWATWPGHRLMAPLDFGASRQSQQTWRGRLWGSARLACYAGAAPRVLAANAGTTADTHALVALVELDNGWKRNTVEHDGTCFQNLLLQKDCVVKNMFSP